MLAINTAMEILVTDVVITVHARDVAMAEYNRFQKLIMICLTLSVEDVVVEYAVHRMALALEGERINSSGMSHWPYVGCLNNDHKMTLQ